MKSIPSVPVFPTTTVFGVSVTLTPGTTISSHVGRDRARRLAEERGISDPYLTQKYGREDSMIGPCPVVTHEEDDYGNTYSRWGISRCYDLEDLRKACEIARLAYPEEAVEITAYERWEAARMQTEKALQDGYAAMRAAYDALIDNLGTLLQEEYNRMMKAPWGDEADRLSSRGRQSDE